MIDLAAVEARMARVESCVFGHEFGAWAMMKMSDGKYICPDHAREVNEASTARATQTTKSQNQTGSYRYMRNHLAKIEEDRARDTAEAEMQKKSPNLPGFIYYVRVNGHIKIGYSIDVRQRMKVYGPTAELLAVHPGTLALEQEIHREFRAELAYGREWFRESGRIMARVAETLETFGRPVKFAYHFRKAA